MSVGQQILSRKLADWQLDIPTRHHIESEVHQASAVMADYEINQLLRHATSKDNFIVLLNTAKANRQKEYNNTYA
jgi:hypothetical protein